MVYPAIPVVFMMASPGQPPVWTTFVPFALILAIFYVLILLPMKRRQKKIAEFQNALKVGDKVITTSGIYGNITKLDEKTVQLQIADRVPIKVSRAAIAGYQGQDPVVTDAGSL